MEPFKSAISPDLIKLIAGHFARVVPGLDAAGFAAPLLSQLESLELKERVIAVAEALHLALPTDPEPRAQALLAVLHPDHDESFSRPSDDTGLSSWGIWPLTHLVGQHGLGTTERALRTLREMTKRGTAEFDVRPFIAADPETALPIISSWVDDPDHHVRRLVSEGTRPRLPWGMRLQGLVADPSPILPVLEKLRDDPSEYVRRSVANHLNDIAKDHPDLVADIAQDWMEGADKNREKMLRHACRTLIKQGHAGALAAFGFRPPELSASITLQTPKVTYGEALAFEVTLSSTGKKPQQLVVDYLVHHQKADGSLSPKPFKWTTFTLAPGEARTLARSHAIKPITTRRYYPGEHRLSLRINGADFGDEAFDLLMD